MVLVSAKIAVRLTHFVLGKLKLDIHSLIYWVYREGVLTSVCDRVLMVGWLQMFGSGITSKASGPSRYETNPSVAAGGGAWLKIVSSGIENSSHP
ncbi:hypothetical protein T4E_3835 [Trichinella pseudospiralis]|uniref:Uncharacterized protein n=1 Tax=Trichinella pseudospiralis TaxID=6337 RepID=A0A0V0XKU8_TRIPS|nr:hypothetical protein T4E_3835 [Trichinella pseudospiralis]